MEVGLPYYAPLTIRIGTDGRARVLDRFVVGEGEVVSMSERGLIEPISDC